LAKHSDETISSAAVAALAKLNSSAEADSPACKSED
jgi:hypothetical protein